MKTEKNLDFLESLENLELGSGGVIIDNVSTVEKLVGETMPTVQKNEVQELPKQVRNLPRYAKMIYVDIETGEVNDNPDPAEIANYETTYQFLLVPPSLGYVSYQANLKEGFMTKLGNEDAAKVEKEIKIVPLFWQPLGLKPDTKYRLFSKKKQSSTPTRQSILWFFKVEDRKVLPELHCMIVKTFSFGSFYMYFAKKYTQNNIIFFPHETIAEVKLVPEGENFKLNIEFSSALPPKYKNAINDYRADLGKEYNQSGELVKEYSFAEPVDFNTFADLLALNHLDFDPYNPDVIPDNCEPFIGKWLNALSERGQLETFCEAVAKKRTHYQKEGLL